MSSTIFRGTYNFTLSRYKLDAMSAGKKMLLTVRFDPQAYIEIAAMADILRARSLSDLVHNQLIHMVEETKKEVDPAVFEEAYNRKKEEIEAHSHRKTLERLAAKNLRLTETSSPEEPQTLAPRQPSGGEYDTAVAPEAISKSDKD